MNLTEGFLLLVIWVHGMAAVTWVGGGIFYIVAIRPQQKPPVHSGPIPTLESLSLFRSLVDICIIVLIVTGVILLFDKLSDSDTGGLYLSVLALKVGLSLWMFAIARNKWRGRMSERERSYKSTGRLGWRLTSRLYGVNLTVILGAVVFFLADFLRYLL